CLGVVAAEHGFDLDEAAIAPVVAIDRQVPDGGAGGNDAALFLLQRTERTIAVQPAAFEIDGPAQHAVYGKCSGCDGGVSGKLRLVGRERRAAGSSVGDFAIAD